jgi:hypothetical protein
VLLPRRIDPSIAQGFDFVGAARARRNTLCISSTRAGATESKNKRAAGQYASAAALVAGLLLAAAILPARASAEQFVLVDLTYEATAQNTMDSHFVANTATNIPKNLKTPIDYATGTAYVRFEVLSKPSAVKTLYNICFYNPSNYACMGYPPAYTATGVYNFSGAFSTFWQGDVMDWTMGINHVELVLKDEKEVKVQGNAMFYPYKTHITITIVSPGSTYVPPGGMPAAGTGASGAGAGGMAGRGGAGASGMGGRSGAAGARAGAGGAGAAATNPGGGAAGAAAGRGAAAGMAEEAGGADGAAGKAAAAIDAGSGDAPSDDEETSSSPITGTSTLPGQSVREQPSKRSPPPGGLDGSSCGVAAPGAARGIGAYFATVAWIVLAGARRRRRAR